MTEGPSKSCAKCGTVFTKPKHYSYAQWESTRFCSVACRSAAGRDASRPWEGSNRCAGFTAPGSPCGDFEIEGLEFCLHHVPDDLLEEAEEITGMKRCRHASGCRWYAVSGTNPPACKNHGANLGSNTSRAAAGRVIEEQVMRQLEAVMAEDAIGPRLTNPPEVGNPLEAMLELVATVREFRLILQERVTRLSASEWRYRGREKEEARAELILYERALDREGRFLKDVNGMGIDQRLAAISERMMAHMERSLDIAIKASGGDLPMQERAREVLRRELAKASLN